jgi:hypothetical protein
MNPFIWLRNSVAESVYAGWRDGFLRIEQEISGVTPMQKTADSESPVSQVETVAIVASQEEQITEPLAPLAPWVERLRLSSSGFEEQVAPAKQETTTGRKPGRPRKHNP